MPDKTWKASERRAAALFGTVRNSLSGGNSKLSRSDSIHSRLFIEAKYRASHAHHSLMKEVAVKAKVEGKLPVIVTQQKYEKGSLIILRHSDLHAFCKQILRDAGYTLLKPKR